MNVARAILNERNVPKVFWPEAVKWCVHVQNRSPTYAIENRTPEEAWSNMKPSVNYFQVFDCVSHVHVPDQKRSKLDDKSKICILLGVRDESKAYRLYDPITKKIVVSRDVVFEEEKSWGWGRTNEECKDDILVWEDEENNDNEQEIEQNKEEEQEIEQNEEEESGENNQNVSNSSSTEIGSCANEIIQEGQIEGRATRNRRAQIWMADYETRTNLFEEENSLAMMMMTESGSDPFHFEESFKSKKWREAMNE